MHTHGGNKGFCYFSDRMDAVDKFLMPLHNVDKVSASKMTMDQVARGDGNRMERIIVKDCPEPSNDPIEVIEKRLQKAIEESNALTECQIQTTI